MGIPVADVGDQSITLSLAPYVLHGIGDSYGGGRVGLNVPIGDQVTLAAYGQYDELLDTVVGGQISYRFATNGGFVNDPNLRPQTPASPMPWQTGEFNTGRPMQIALNQGNSHEPAQPALQPATVASTSLDHLISDADGVVRLKAGEEATFSPDGVLLSQQMMSKERFSQLILETMSGQNLLPESHVINLIYQQLYGLPDRTLLSILGSDWLIAARTPYPRLRGANNLVVPDNKLPQEDEIEPEEEEEKEEEEEEEEEEDNNDDDKEDDKEDEDDDNEEDKEEPEPEPEPGTRTLSPNRSRSGAEPEPEPEPEPPSS